MIIKYTIIEAYKKHLFTLLCSAFIACIVLGYYAKSISIIEGQAAFNYFYNAAMRLTAVFLLAWYCIISQTQQLEKARLQMQMALPISRTRFCMASLLAYYSMAFIMAFVASLPFILITEAAWFAWFASLFLELAIIVTVAYILSLLFSQSTVAISLFTLIYIFARNAAEFIRHANVALDSANDFFSIISLWLIKIIALLVPKLENYANSVIVESGLSAEQFAYLLIEALLYISLLFFIAKMEWQKKVL